MIFQWVYSWLELYIHIYRAATGLALRQTDRNLGVLRNSVHKDPITESAKADPVALALIAGEEL